MPSPVTTRRPKPSSNAVFVEVRDHVIKPELGRTRLKTRCSQQMREAANLLRGEGEKLGAQLGMRR